MMSCCQKRWTLLNFLREQVVWWLSSKASSWDIWISSHSLKRRYERVICHDLLSNSSNQHTCCFRKHKNLSLLIIDMGMTEMPIKSIVRNLIACLFPCRWTSRNICFSDEFRSLDYPFKVSRKKDAIHYAKRIIITTSTAWLLRPPCLYLGLHNLAPSLASSLRLKVLQADVLFNIPGQDFATKFCNLLWSCCIKTHISSMSCQQALMPAVIVHGQFRIRSSLTLVELHW